MVDHAGDDDVQGNREGVKPDDSGRVVFVGVAHFTHDCDEGLVSGVGKSDVQDGFKLSGHGCQRIWTESHDERLVGWLVKISSGVGIGAIDTKSNDRDEYGADW